MFYKYYDNEMQAAMAILFGLQDHVILLYCFLSYSRNNIIIFLLEQYTLRICLWSIIHFNFQECAYYWKFLLSEHLSLTWESTVSISELFSARKNDSCLPHVLGIVQT